jgi:hypothetical protein
VKLSTPPVRPSARPRKSEKVPSVTINGGNSQFRYQNTVEKTSDSTEE